MPEANPPPANRFEPLHSAHAIEQVVFSAQVDRQLDDAQLNAADAAIAAAVGADLPKRSELKVVMFSIGGPGAPAAPGAGSAGVIFQRIRDDGTVEAELRIDRAAFTYRDMRYTRWVEVWGKTRRYFEILVPIFASASTLNTIGLTYIDKFVWHGDAATCEPGSILQRGSPYICPHVFAVTDLWHCHTGSFRRLNSRTKQLMNVNIDVLDEAAKGGQRRVVSILTVLSDMLNQVGYDPTAVTSVDAMNVLNEHMERLHFENKSILGAIISEQMSKRIALKE